MLQNPYPPMCYPFLEHRDAGVGMPCFPQISGLDPIPRTWDLVSKSWDVAVRMAALDAPTPCVPLVLLSPGLVWCSEFPVTGENKLAPCSLRSEDPRQLLIRVFA